MSSKKNSIVSGILKYSVSTWANLIIGFLSVIITTRLLMPDTYGLISLFYSVTTVLMYIMTLGMDSAMIRFYNEPPHGNTISQLLYKNISLATILCFVIGLCATIIFGRILSQTVFGFCSRAIVGMVFIYCYCQIVLRYLNISFRMSFQAKKYTIQNVLVNCLSRILVIIAAFFTTGFLYIVIILSIGTLSILFFYLFFQRKEIIPVTTNGLRNYSINFVGYNEYFRFALFSAPTYIVTYLNSYLSQQIISSTLTAYALGIFASTHTFGQILSAVKGGFATYWSAFVYKNYEVEKKKISKMHDYVMLFSIIMVSILVMCRDVIYLVIGKNFHDSKQFFSLLLILPILSFLLETTDKGIALAKKNELNLTTHTISVFTNVILCFVGVKYYGLMGAAYANAISGIVLYVLNSYLGQRYYKSIINMRKSTIGFVVLITILTIPATTLDIRVIIVSCFLLDVLSLLAYKEQINKIYHIIISRFS